MLAALAMTLLPLTCPPAAVAGNGDGSSDGWSEIRILDCEFPTAKGFTTVLKTDLDSENRLHDAIHFQVDEKTVLIFSTGDVSSFRYTGNALEITAVDPDRGTMLNVRLGNKAAKDDAVRWTVHGRKFEAKRPAAGMCRLKTYEQA